MMENKTPLWTKQFILMLFINSILFLGMTSQLSTLPIYIKELTDNDSIVGITAAVYTGAAFLARAFAGYSLDRFGRRVMLFIGLTIACTLMLTYTWFSTIGVIIVIRLLHGIGWGTSTTSSMTIASDSIPRERFAEGLGYFTLSNSLALALAPVIGFGLMDWLGYRYMTYIAAGMIAVAMIPALFLKLEKADKEKTKRKFIPYEKTSLRPSLIMVFVGITMGTIYVFIALYGNSLNLDNVALFFTVFAVALFLIRPVIGKLVDKHGFKIAMIPALLVFALSMVMLYFTKSLTMFLLSALVLGASYGIIYTCLQTMSIVNAPKNRRGTANATFLAGYDVGIGLGGIIGGIIADALGYGLMFLSMTVPIIIAAVLYFLIAKNIRKVSDEEIEQAAAVKK